MTESSVWHIWASVHLISDAWCFAFAVQEKSIDMFVCVYTVLPWCQLPVGRGACQAEKL